MGADVDDRLSLDKSTTITEFHGLSHATVHCRIVFACFGAAIEKKLERISATLQREGASDVSIAVSVNRESFRPTATGHSSARWMAPSKGDGE